MNFIHSTNLENMFRKMQKRQGKSEDMNILVWKMTISNPQINYLTQWLVRFIRLVLHTQWFHLRTSTLILKPTFVCCHGVLTRIHTISCHRFYLSCSILIANPPCSVSPPLNVNLTWIFIYCSKILLIVDLQCYKSFMATFHHRDVRMLIIAKIGMN
jgi:hypothetical protein